MKAIYIDNFRGIDDSLIDLKSVNFLVGENSTGKTSFLAVIKILGSHRFWFNPSFNDPDVHFSSFTEIVRKKSENSSSFTLGLLEEKTNEKENSPQKNVRLLTFTNSKGLPSISRYSFFSNIGLITTVLQDGLFKYKIQKCDDLNITEILELCKIEHKQKNLAEYQQIKKKGFPKTLFFVNAYQFVTADLAGKDLLSKKEFTFQFEMSTPSCKWIAPIRAKPEKIYLSNQSEYSAEGEHIPNLLNQMLWKPDKSSKIVAAINKFGEESGLFTHIGVKRFGKEAMSPFEVTIELANNMTQIGNVGYGVSQVLPVIFESRTKGQIDYVAIQQPEVHLHPKAQAALGEFIFDSAKETGNKFVIETHSDYLIDRFRLCTNKSSEKIDSQILFFERCEDRNKITTLLIDELGGYPSDQPKNFRDFFIREEIKLMSL